MENTETTASESAAVATDSKEEMLIVASKLKSYIRAKSGMNTSDAVVKALSQRVRQLADQAVERARTEGRKTVMDRDFA